MHLKKAAQGLGKPGKCSPSLTGPVGRPQLSHSWDGARHPPGSMESSGCEAPARLGLGGPSSTASRSLPLLASRSASMRLEQLA
eukprot:15466535-Alexandrium_andersonii.AAC.1